MARYADDILPARRPAAQWYVPVLATVVSAIGAVAFAVALIRAVG